MMKSLTHILCCLAMPVVMSLSLHAEKPQVDVYSLNIEQNLATPEVNQKHSAAVIEAMDLLTRTLKQAGLDASGVRKGEVTMVTIPCSDLFAPNSIIVKDNGKAILAKLTPYIKRSDKYKTVLAVHSDDTGDDVYAERLTADRANAIDEYYSAALGGESPVIPYGLGNDEPVASNSGINNRAKNRRVEIYFVPTTSFIDNARKKK
ncbi:MAG: OmpA family protein [Muribaculaceae bacterium]|nr:OmpA family protein [Muribaculaceae bacterium]